MKTTPNYKVKWKVKPLEDSDWATHHMAEVRNPQEVIRCKAAPEKKLAPVNSGKRYWYSGTFSESLPGAQMIPLLSVEEIEEANGS